VLKEFQIHLWIKEIEWEIENTLKEMKPERKTPSCLLAAFLLLLLILPLACPDLPTSPGTAIARGVPGFLEALCETLKMPNLVKKLIVYIYTHQYKDTHKILCQLHN
jgi:hypothetical protein